MRMNEGSAETAAESMQDWHRDGDLLEVFYALAGIIIEAHDNQVREPFQYQSTVF